MTGRSARSPCGSPASPRCVTRTPAGPCTSRPPGPRSPRSRTVSRETATRRPGGPRCPGCASGSWMRSAVAQSRPPPCKRNSPPGAYCGTTRCKVPRRSRTRGGSCCWTTPGSEKRSPRSPGCSRYRPGAERCSRLSSSCRPGMWRMSGSARSRRGHRAGGRRYGAGPGGTRPSP